MKTGIRAFLSLVLISLVGAPAFAVPRAKAPPKPVFVVERTALSIRDDLSADDLAYFEAKVEAWKMQLKHVVEGISFMSVEVVSNKKGKAWFKVYGDADKIEQHRNYLQAFADRAWRDSGRLSNPEIKCPVIVNETENS